MFSGQNKSFLISALIGSVIGAAVTLLFTPFSGSQIRKKMGNGINHLNGFKRGKSSRLPHLHLNGSSHSIVAHRGKALHAKSKKTRSKH